MPVRFAVRRRRGLTARLALALLATHLAAGATAGRDDLVASIRAATADADHVGVTIGFAWRLGAATRRATLRAATAEQASIGLDGATIVEAWSALRDDELYAIAAAALPDDVPSHERLIAFAIAAGLGDATRAEAERLRRLGGAVPDAASPAGAPPADAREQRAEAAWARLAKTLAGTRSAHIAADARAFLAAHGDTACATAHRAVIEEAIARATPPTSATFNIPRNDGPPLDTVWWPIDKRVNQLLYTNGPWDASGLVWFGRMPAIEEGFLGDDQVEVRALWDDGGLHVVFAVADASVMRYDASSKELAYDRLYVLVGAGERGGARPGPEDRMFMIPLATTHLFANGGGRQAWRGDGERWVPWDPPVPTRPLPAELARNADDRKPQAWRHHSFYFFAGDDGRYAGYTPALWFAWETLGISPGDAARFRIAFMLADHDRDMPDLYAPPAKPGPRAKAHSGDRSPAPADPAVRILPDPLPDPHARLAEMTEIKDGKAVVRRFLTYPFDGTHPSWRGWDAETRTIWHRWPPNLDANRPATWASARTVNNRICEIAGKDLRGDEIDGGADVACTWTGWGVNVPHDRSSGNGDLMVHPELYPVHMRDFALKSYIRFRLDRLKGKPKRAFVPLPCWGGDGGDTGPSLCGMALLEDVPWWPETLTQSDPWQPMPVMNSVHRTWVDKVGSAHRDTVFEVTDLLDEALREGRRTLDLALASSDTDFDTGKYFRKADLRLVVQYDER